MRPQFRRGPGAGEYDAFHLLQPRRRRATRTSDPVGAARLRQTLVSPPGTTDLSRQGKPVRRAWPLADDRRALAGSTRFVLLASPEAAQSRWVTQEVAWWLANKSPELLLVVLTSGDLVWDETARDFDWSRTTALPHTLRRSFGSEPLWVDLRWVHQATHLSTKDPRFLDAVADLAAPLRGQSKEDLVGEDVRQHQRALRLARGGISSLILLLLATAAAAVIAVGQRDEAIRQQQVAISRQLAAQRSAVSTNSTSAYCSVSLRTTWHRHLKRIRVC